MVDNVPQKKSAGRPKRAPNRKNKGKGYSCRPSEQPWVSPKPSAKKVKSKNKVSNEKKYLLLR